MNVLNRIKATFTFWRLLNTKPRGCTSKPTYPYNRYTYGIGTYTREQAFLIRRLMKKFGFTCRLRGRGSRAELERNGIQLNMNKDIPFRCARDFAIYVDVPSNYRYWKIVEREQKEAEQRRNRELMREFGIDEMPTHPVDVNVRFEDV